MNRQSKAHHRRIFKTPDQSPQTLGELWREFHDTSQLFKHKAKRGAGRRESAIEDTIFETLAGSGQRLSNCLASDVRARQMAARLLLEQLRIVLESDPDTQFALVTVIDQAHDTSDEKTVIQLRQMFEDITPALQDLAPHGIAVAELLAFTNVRHPAGGKLLSLHSHNIVWGKAPLPIDQTARKWGGRFTTITAKVPGLVIDPIRPNLIDLARALRYPLKASYRCKTRYFNPTTGRENLHESEKGDRFIRYNRLFEILSNINLRRLLDAHGDGLEILETVGEQMRNWARENAGTPEIGVDDIPTYWAKHRQAHYGQRRFQPPIIR